MSAWDHISPTWLAQADRARIDLVVDSEVRRHRWDAEIASQPGSEEDDG